MKKLFLIIFVLLTTTDYAQQTLPCTQIGVNNLAGPNPYITGSCLEVSSDLHVNNKNVIMEADNRIHFGAGAHISPNQQGYFHASIRPNALQVAWMEPGTVGSVGQFKKLELGIILDNEIEALIDEFIAAGKSDVAPRTNPSLNPFDPDEIDVYAEFYYMQNPGSWTGPYKQNGFFFEDFVRNQSDPDPANWSWDKVPSEYRFRVRFTPKNTGTWKCRIIAQVHGYWQYSTSFFTFNVTPSDGHDFVSVGPNKRFLKIGNEPFFPVGMNLTDQQCYIDQNGTWDYPPDDIDPYGYGCIGFPDATYEAWAGDANGGITSRLKVYDIFEQEMEAFASAGANYFKMDVLPWFSEIEYENLCNYYNRMHIGWEVDNIVEKAEQSGLFIHFNTSIQYYFGKPDRLYWDWPANGEVVIPPQCEVVDHGYCYNKDLGLTDPKSFFTDYLAIKYYKNRLRYMVARWGYSTNISAFETINEINGTCGTKEIYFDPDKNKCKDVENSYYAPYDHETLFRQQVNSWQEHMINSLKQNMGYNQHMTSVNYLTGGPEINDDLTYYTNSLDLITHQNYGNFPDLYKNSVNIVNDLHNNANANSDGWPYCDKPFIHGEFGSGATQGYYLCDNDASWIRDLWIGSFTGTCGSAMLWDNQHRRDLWPHFGRLRAFVAGYDFDESNGDQKGWIPYHDFDEMHYENWQRKPGIVDLFYLRSPDEKRAVGVLANRTYNFYTQWNVAKCGAFVWESADEDGDGRPNSQEDFEMTDNSDTWDDQAYNSAHTAYYINESLSVDVKSKKTYIVKYFNANTLQIVGSEEKYNATGRLNLNFPFITGSAPRPIILFTVEPKNKNKSSEQYLDSTNKEMNAIAFDFQNNGTNDYAIREARIFPNPAGEFINIELPDNTSICRVELLSSTGILVKSDQFFGASYKLSLEGIDTGLYVLRMVHNQATETFKLIVE